MFEIWVLVSKINQFFTRVDYQITVVIALNAKQWCKTEFFINEKYTKLQNKYVHSIT